MSEDLVLSIKNLTKEFPGVKALDQVHFELKKGEVHALLGENGAGKSTLMKLITGVIQKDAGEILYNGKPIDSWTVKETQAAGIGMIYQELNLVPNMTVVENVFLGREKLKSGLLNYLLMESETQHILSQLGVCLDVNTVVKKLSIAYQQIVEIAKVVSLNVKVLIMDEPTASLTNEEVELLFALVHNLKKTGVSVIYISHRLEELSQICDRATVFRDGKYIKTVDVNKTSKSELISLMVGRDMNHLFPERFSVSNDAEIILETKGLSNTKIHDISIQLKKGELLGIAGLVGAGRTEFLRALSGADSILGGEIIKNGSKISINNPIDSFNNKIAMVPEDRKLHGLILGMSVSENLVFPNMKKYSKAGFLNKDKIKKSVLDTIKNLQIKTPSTIQKAKLLSGGNQQKVVIGKWLLSEPDILLIDEPTRGIDVGAKYEIYCLLNELKKNGKSIIMVSSEMPELIGMSDRIYVFCNGKVTGHLEKNEMNEESILKFASDFGNSSETENYSCDDE